MQASNEHAEWDIPDSAVPLSQGDLLLRRDPATRDIHLISVIITADCDITHGKYGTQLASLRIIPLREYVRHYWAGRKLRRFIETETGKVHELINVWHLKKSPEGNRISSETVVSWIRECNSDTICRELEVPGGEQKKVSDSLDRFRAILEALD